MAKTEISLRERKTQLLNKLSDLLKDADEDVQRDFEYWISAHIANPMAKAVSILQFVCFPIKNEDRKVNH